MQKFQQKSIDIKLQHARLAVMTLLTSVFFGILLSRLYYLQVVEHEKHLNVSNKNRIDIRPITPKRGLIFDKNGIIMADNQPSFSLTLTPEKITDLAATKKHLNASIALSKSQFAILDAINKIPRRPFEALTLKDRLTREEIAAVIINQHKLPGVNVEADLRRFYPFGPSSAHLLGFVGQISESEYNALEPNMRSITRMGKKGLELSYETQLRGSPGLTYVETNAKGRFIKTLTTNPPTAGMDLQLTIDSRLQQDVFTILSKYKRAAAVAIEPGTGAILAIASVPSYDPNAFVSGMSHDKYRELRNNNLRPLFNRAVQGQYPPGSTIKPMIALAALDAKLINWEQQIWDPGFYQLDRHPIKYRCWKRYGHGYVNLNKAIVESCDTYFYNLGKNMPIDLLRQYMLGFSIGQRTGIDLNGESQGLFPSEAWKRLNFKKPWFPGETLIATIGQGYVLSTPLQLAQATAILANRGFSLAPHIVAKTRQNTKESTWLLNYPTTDQPPIQKIHFNDPHWQRMLQSLIDVVEAPQGTARSIKHDLTYTLAGKTGTAQVIAIPQGDRYNPDELKEEHLDHALFIGFAPAESPSIALAVIIENGGGGGAVAAPVAREILDAHFKYNRIMQ